MTQEAMKLALEALESVLCDPEGNVCWQGSYADRDIIGDALDVFRTAISEALAEHPAQQEPVAWKLVPIEPTKEMLKAMDECSTEGYDERLYAGHAASVYMAAVDVAPSPPQRTWVDLTSEDWNEIFDNALNKVEAIKLTKAKLKEKNFD